MELYRAPGKVLDRRILAVERAERADPAIRHGAAMGSSGEEAERGLLGERPARERNRRAVTRPSSLCGSGVGYEASG
jgi:hypothetical protein